MAPDAGEPGFHFAYFFNYFEFHGLYLLKLWLID